MGVPVWAGQWKVLSRVNAGARFDLNLTVSALRACAGKHKRNPGYREPVRSQLTRKMRWFGLR